MDSFTGEDVEVRLDDWLPSLERAKLWNDWTEDELLLQLARHLRGRARQEWSLLGVNVKKSYEEAIKALRLRLDPGSRTLATQEFRHTSQGDNEKVADSLGGWSVPLMLRMAGKACQSRLKTRCYMDSSKTHSNMS